MADFRRVTEAFWASPQINLDDVAEASARGFGLIINNRPEGEAADQIPGAEIARAAHEAGLDYCAIPVSPGGFSEQQVEALIDALSRSEGPVLAYCRSGTRSTLLWSLAQARLGRDADAIASEARGAGYDVTSIRPLLDTLAARNRR